ncbi:adenylyltransferase/cytidyltransferase family protein [Tritonibacter scottomollicae]|uniref:Glycerol-3-phosphate cytidylyltransferase n=1 Tax=Tritonibacter scottomollicae TaxID=483013 RepID=A0A2T1A5J0_TRISK|nr:adenylyltransferase/cytidyltransferase family protein [Tritonibacter scottomollicae]PRZ43859.1 glycerol-3-phosphate cytidylyltransferase [Tritonibacter scottomollicae]
MSNSQSPLDGAKSPSVIGYTTGVFDMFHIGHLNLLRRAKAACDHLVVGVTSDELALARKGRSPVIPQVDRMAIVKALSCVDEVVEQKDMDKLAAWKRIGFHRMFVGDDWKGHPKWVALEQDFAPKGVEILYFPYTTSVSSTRLRNVVDPETGT